jgi:hypothetical protein
MADRITHFLHQSIVTGAQAVSTGGVFSLTSVHDHDLTASLPTFQKAGNFRGIVDGLIVKLTSAAAATTILIRICADAAGDEVLIPDTEATLVDGVTTAATKTAAFKVDLPLFQPLANGGGHLYVFVQADGAAVVAQTILYWQE